MSFGRTFAWDGSPRWRGVLVGPVSDRPIPNAHRAPQRSVLRSVAAPWSVHPCGTAAVENRRHRAFTLVEVLLVLALLALFAAVFVPGVNSILDQMSDRGPEQLLNEAVLAARTDALESGRAVELRYDTEKRQLVYGEADVRSDALPLGVTLELLPMQSGSSILLGGELTEVQQPLARVRFFPDGTCEPFRLRVKSNPDAKPRILVVDPWTCALSFVPTKGGT